ncbi:MAG: futalosine hydrolase [Bacteroidetes bacterium]|nr:futalosine hydrolase [Bacteroidota bacterium]
MHILITAATSMEIQSTVNFLEEKKYELSGAKIQVAITGIGLVSTAYLLTREIHDERPTIAIQAGIAGCFKAGKANHVVSVGRDVIADIGVYENDSFKNIFDLKLNNKNNFPFSNGYLVNPYEKLLSITGIEKANAISVNEITTNKSRIEWYQQKYDPIVESMEGAAFHYVCLHEKIPFLQLRAVSNIVGERDKSKWTIKSAISALNENLVTMIKKLSTHDETYFRI